VSSKLDAPADLPQGIRNFRDILWPIPVAARFKTWVYGRSLAAIVGSNLSGGMGVCLL
jgi:hypothetical protein